MQSLKLFEVRSSARGRNSKGLEKFALHGMSDRFQPVMGVEFLINVV
jgi:hypothetical protein